SKYVVNNQANKVAKATIYITTAVDVAASVNTSMISLIDISLYTYIPTKSPYTTATPADSVGVKIPLYIPPKIITGHINPQAAFLNAIIITLNDILSDATILLLFLIKK